MKHKLFLITGLIVLAMISIATAPAGALDLFGVGTGTATRVWDQTLRCDSIYCVRFLILTNMGSEAVLDKETGLVWERSPSTCPFCWEDAQEHCNSLAKGGRLGWRLPTVQELASLVDPAMVPDSIATLPPGHPFHDVQQSFYWTATTHSFFNLKAWRVDFYCGKLSTCSLWNDHYAWCVRGGQGVDTQ